MLYFGFLEINYAWSVYPSIWLEQTQQVCDCEVYEFQTYISLAIDQLFQMHLNLENSESSSTPAFVVVIGLVGIIVSTLANIISMEEMYPLFVKSVSTEIKTTASSSGWIVFLSHLPTSVAMSWFSDFCILTYGIWTGDVLIGLYGFLNSLVVFTSILLIQNQVGVHRNNHADTRTQHLPQHFIP